MQFCNPRSFDAKWEKYGLLLYPPLGPPQPPLVTVMYGLFPRETFPPTFLLEIGPGIFQVYILGTPPLPHTLEMLHNNLLIFYKLI